MIKRLSRLQNDEKDQLVSELVALSTGQRKPFMVAHGLPGSLSKKEEVKSRIIDAVDSGDVSYEAIVEYLDQVVPWGKQHVFLFDGPENQSISKWKKPTEVAKLLKKQAPDFHAVYEQPELVVLPDTLSPISVQLSKDSIRLAMVKRRQWWEPAPEHNPSKKGKTDSGEEIEYRAFVHRRIRSFVAFEWNLRFNTAFLQISQLPRHTQYEQTLKEFTKLVSPWLDMSLFSMLDLHKVILNLLALDLNKKPVARTDAFAIHSGHGRFIRAQSGPGNSSVFGDPAVDQVFKTAKKKGVGNTGNLYWLPKPGTPLVEELRIVIVGSKNRINFTSPSDEQTVRHVLSDIRNHC